MRYLGGKSRISKHIVEILIKYRNNDQIFVEPFVGAASVISKLTGECHAYDNHKPLIELYKALQNGWIPPHVLTEESYNNLKTENIDLALKAFAGFGCSFGGKYFGGYARDSRGG